MSFNKRDEPEVNLDQVLERLRGFLRRFRIGGGGSFAYIVIGVLLLATVVWVATGAYTVQPGEVSVLRLFGKAQVEQGSPGLHWFYPAPIGKKTIVFVDEVKRLELGFRGGQTIPGESLMITGDENIVDVQLLVQFNILDPQAFLFESVDPAGSVIKDVAETALREVVGSSTIDDVIINREQIQTDAKRKIQNLLTKYETGINVTEVKLQAVNPPDPVQAAFADVVIAKEDKEKIINLADAYEEDILPKARGDARKVIEEARAFKAQRINEATGKAGQFTAILIEYRKSPDVTRQRLVLEAMEEILPGIVKFIVDPDIGVFPFLPLGGDKASPIPFAP
jgi:membrane protease subunit HflK